MDAQPGQCTSRTRAYRRVGAGLSGDAQPTPDPVRRPDDGGWRSTCRRLANMAERESTYERKAPSRGWRRRSGCGHNLPVRGEALAAAEAVLGLSLGPPVRLPVVRGFRDGSLVALWGAQTRRRRSSRWATPPTARTEDCFTTSTPPQCCWAGWLPPGAQAARGQSDRRCACLRGPGRWSFAGVVPAW